MMSNEPHPIQNEETLSRFLQSEKVRADGTVKSQAFKPSGPHHSVSVYRTDFMQDDEINQAVKSVSVSRPVIGVTRLTPIKIRKLDLDVIPEESISRWHADIIKFPLGNKPKVTSLAQQLAAAASLVEYM